VYSLGHIPEDPEVVHAKEGLEAGLNEIAHLDEFTHEFLVEYDPGVRGWVGRELDTERIYEVVQTIAERDAAVTATPVTNETVLLGLEDMDTLLQRPEYQRIKAESIHKWQAGGRMVKWHGQEAYLCFVLLAGHTPSRESLCTKGRSGYEARSRPIAIKMGVAILSRTLKPMYLSNLGRSSP
jgi:hypothetical protein